MGKSLYVRLVAVLVGLTVVMAALFLVVIRHSDTARNQEINQRLYRSLAARLIEEQIFEEQTADPGAVARVFERIRLVNPRIDVYLLDQHGRVVAGSGQNALKRASVDLAPIQRFLKGDEKLPILGEDPSETARQRVFSVAPVQLAGSESGYLYLVLRGFSGDSLAQRIKQSYVFRESLSLLAIGLIVALVASAFIITIMTRPLRQLSAVMDKFRQSGFAEQPEPLRLPRDEIGRLTDTFNRMSDRILAQMTELRRTDAMRRELVANISHDLRTPLASLQGYLETLHLKAAQLNPEEQRSYLEIALRHTEQLSALVSRLFDLAKLDSGQVVLASEPFALGDLVQDVTQEFELAATERNVRLETHIRADLPLVVGDVGLLERVLRNLIENALRYAGSGGTVTVSADAGAQRAVLEVRDTGPGIPADDIPHVFDRFYRSEKSRSLQNGHAGLGLAISKRILELHGSEITVRSTPGDTAFRFTIAYSDAAGGLTSESEGPARPPRQVPVFAYPMADSANT